MIFCLVPFSCRAISNHLLRPRLSMHDCSIDGSSCVVAQAYHPERAMLVIRLGLVVLLFLTTALLASLVFWQMHLAQVQQARERGMRSSREPVLHLTGS